MESPDYNGMYEYLYAMKYQEQFPPENYPDGIPKEEIESYAVFDEEKQTYRNINTG